MYAFKIFNGKQLQPRETTKNPTQFFVCLTRVKIRTPLKSCLRNKGKDTLKECAYAFQKQALE